MDNRQFDELVKRLSQNRLSRIDALRGLAASALTGLAGVGLLRAESEAEQRHKGKGKAHKNTEGQSHAKSQGKGKGKGKEKGKGNGKGNAHAKQVEICHCPPGNPTNCHTLTIGEKAAHQHLHQHTNDRLGPCAGQTTTTTTTAPPTTTTTTTAPPTTTTTTTTTTTAPPCIPRTGVCSGGDICCTTGDICGDGGKCCGDSFLQAPCSKNEDCCPCFENDINRCICNTTGGYCVMTEIG